MDRCQRSHALVKVRLLCRANLRPCPIQTNQAPAQAQAQTEAQRHLLALLLVSYSITAVLAKAGRDGVNPLAELIKGLAALVRAKVAADLKKVRVSRAFFRFRLVSVGANRTLKNCPRKVASTLIVPCSFLCPVVGFE